YSGDITYLGKPVYKTENIPSDALVVSAVVLSKPLTVSKKLDRLGIENLDYFLFRRFSGLEILPVTMWDGFNDDYIRNTEKYDWVRNILADTTSKTIFDNLIAFRRTGNLEYMSDFTDCPHLQYFEEFLRFPEGKQTFVDVGGYDGDYKSVHIFEPEKSNIEKAKEKLKTFEKINYHMIGLSDRAGSLRFSVDGPASRIDGAGECLINIDRLDNIVREPVHFIKMDIEGAENSALDGSVNTILDSHPVLAICVYHKGDDFWLVPEHVLSYRDDYAVYLRHYTEGVTETVMFFVPN
ncbi:MAG: FkbM family methyltransferase, partial [Candidatus Thiodiazotropha sp. 6PLUC3]